MGKENLELTQIRHQTEGLCCVECYRTAEALEPAQLVFDGWTLCIAHYKQKLRLSLGER